MVNYSHELQVLVTRHKVILRWGWWGGGVRKILVSYDIEISFFGGYSNFFLDFIVTVKKYQNTPCNGNYWDPLRKRRPEGFSVGVALLQRSSPLEHKLEIK